LNYFSVNGDAVRFGDERERGVKTIRGLRQARGWTQFALALKVGVQPQAVYLWERGLRTPRVPQLRKLGRTFGLCSDDIVLEPRGEPEDASYLPPAGRHPNR
jgi:transcriptional regulator with XRE-family HTH domain